MHSARMDRKLIIMRADVVDDGYQTRPGPYLPVGVPVWAAKDEISDGERFRADGVWRDMTVRFRVRYSLATAGIRHSDRLICEGKTYGIGGIKELGRREGFEITASMVPE